MNLEIILDSLEEKKLLPNMERLVKYLHDNFESLKEAEYMFLIWLHKAIVLLNNLHFLDDG